MAADSRPVPDGPAAPGGRTIPSIRLPGIVLGVGLGGFVDGILLHQILQWHHMLSSTDTDRIGVTYYPTDTVHGLQINTVWDGVFHTFTWLSVLTGLALLYSRLERSPGRVWPARALAGLVLFGWGLFNLVEGLVNHQILGIHHVRSGQHQVWWDLGFLALGVLLMIVGRLVERGARPPAGRRRAASTGAASTGTGSR